MLYVYTDEEFKLLKKDLVLPIKYFNQKMLNKVVCQISRIP